MMLVHPLSMLLIVGFIDTYRMFPEELSHPKSFMGKAYTATQRALIYSIVDGKFYGNWLFSVATSLYLPLWAIALANLSNDYCP